MYLKKYGGGGWGGGKALSHRPSLQLANEELESGVLNSESQRRLIQLCRGRSRVFSVENHLIPQAKSFSIILVI